MYSIQQKLDAVVQGFGLVSVEKHKLLGEICGTPMTMSVVGAYPLALFFAFRVAPSGEADSNPQPDWLPDLPVEKGSVSFENGIVWLSLDDLSKTSSDAIRQTLQDFAAALRTNGVAVQNGCLCCGSVTGAALMYVDERATRVCPACLSQAKEEKNRREEVINLSGFGSALSLPLVLVLAAIGWAMFWFSLALYLEWREISTFAMNQYFFLLVIAFFAAAGCVIGWPLGKAFRRAAGNESRTREWAILMTVAVVVLGEVIEVVVHVFRVAGVFDPYTAFALMGPVLASYSAFWLTSKAVMAISLGVSFYRSAAKKTVRMAI